MENATKALLIAASVLIVIIIIALGLKVLSSPMGTIDQVEQAATSMEVSAFNSNFTKYEGKQTASAVKRLLSFVATSNQQNNNKHISVNGSINGENFHAESAEDILNLSQKIANVSYIKFGLDANGYVAEISISDNSNNTGYYTIADLPRNPNVEPTRPDEPESEPEPEPEPESRPEPEPLATSTKPNYQDYVNKHNISDVNNLIQVINATCSDYPVNLEIKVTNGYEVQTSGNHRIDNIDDLEGLSDLLNYIEQYISYYDIQVSESSSESNIVITGRS